MQGDSRAGVRTGTPDLIQDVAEILFATHGFYGTSTHEIAAQAGVKQSLICYHFGSKEALFRGLVARRAEPFCRLPLDALDGLQAAGGFTVEDVFGAFIRPALRQFGDAASPYRAYIHLLSQAHLARCPTLRETFDIAYAQVVVRFRAALLELLAGAGDAIDQALGYLQGAIGSLLGVGGRLGPFSPLGPSSPIGPSSPPVPAALIDAWVGRQVGFAAGGCAALCGADLPQSAAVAARTRPIAGTPQRPATH